MKTLWTGQHWPLHRQITDRFCEVIMSGDKLVDLFCPFPANRVRSDEANLAAALIEQLRKRLHGEPASVINASFQMHPSSGCP